MSAYGNSGMSNETLIAVLRLIEACKSLRQYCIENPSKVTDVPDDIWVPFTERMEIAEQQVRRLL